MAPHESNWENGKMAVKHSAWWTAALVFIDVLRITLGEGGLRGRYGWLTLTCFALAASTYWLTAAFTFGYFFTHIQGRTGVQKGARVALFLIIALAPSGILFADAARLGFFFLLYFVVLGLQFDRYNLHHIYNKEISLWALKEYENKQASSVLYESAKTALLGGASNLVFQYAKVWFMYALIQAAPRLLGLGQTQ
jgi:hypothetical protein